MTENEIEEALLISVLTAFPDRVAKRRRPGARELVLAGGGSATLTHSSVVHDPAFVVAVDAEERREKAGADKPGPTVRLASAIEIEWLAALFPESVVQKAEVVWNEIAGRVDEVRRTIYGQITLEETVKPAAPSEEVSRILVSALYNRRLSIFQDISSLPSYQARMALIAKHFPGEKVPDVSEIGIRAVVEALCKGKRSLADFDSLSLVDALAEGLTHKQRLLLKREVPERTQLKSGRFVRIHYEPAKPPWIESRLQDFFGTYSTPAVCDGKVPLTIHLLAPNGRAVQITKDLAGFWANHYASVRRELQRRYPKHAWPDPASLNRNL